MRKLLAILAGGILITLLAACNLSDMFKGKSTGQQTTENPPPPPPAADNQVPPPADNPPASDQGYQGGSPSGQYASASTAPQGNYPQSSGYASQGTPQASYVPPPPQYSTSQIDQMVAPIALYPDALMTQVLMAAAYPYDVADADQWLQSNRGLSGPYLDDALATSSWDPSVIALCKFPTALDRMAGDIQWTTDLGNAFIYQKNDVLSAVQRLRQEAYRSGHLRTSPQQRVVVDTQYIVIQPYTPNVYYVPYYNPTIVYGSAWNCRHYYYRSVYVPPPSPGYAFVNGFAWGAGVAFGNVLFGGCDWNHRNVYVNNTVVYNNTIYRNTDYYRHRDRYPGQGHGNWAYNAHYNSPREGFVRAPYAGRAHGSIRGLPENTARGGRHAAYLGTNYDQGGQRRMQGQGGGQNRMQGQGQGMNKKQGQGQGGGMNRLEGTGGGQGQGGKNRMQGQGMNKMQGQGQGQGQNRMQGQGQGMNKKQGQGGGMNRLEGTAGGQGQNKMQGQGQGVNKKQGQGQGGGMNRLEGTGGGQGQGGKNRMQGQGGGQNKMQGQGQGMNKKQGQGQGLNKKQGQGQGMNKMQGQGQGGGMNKKQGQGGGMNKKQGQGGGQNKMQGQGQGGGQNNPAKHPKKNQNQGQGGGG